MKNSYSTHSTVEIYEYEILLHLTFILYYIKASGFNLLRTSVPYLHNCFQIFQDTSCQMLVVAPLPLYALANSDPEFRSSRILIWSSGLAEGNTIPFHYNARPGLLCQDLPLPTFITSPKFFTVFIVFLQDYSTYWTEATSFFVVTVTIYCCPNSLSLAAHPLFSVIYFTLSFPLYR
jgi:hypothetical protein